MYKIETIFSKEIDRDVNLYIYTKSYNNLRTYPVLYLHDGQNLFSEETSSYGHFWHIIESFDTFKLPEVIVVGVDCAPGYGKLDEYNPYLNHNAKKYLLDVVGETIGGNGDIYLVT
ncbi:alpha/beta hydrolase-fold protein [Mycoplasmatota bacterium WC44]